MPLIVLLFLLGPQPSHANTPEDIAMGQILLLECASALVPRGEFVPSSFVPAIDELTALLPVTKEDLMVSPLSQVSLHDFYDHVEIRMRMLKYYLRKLGELPQMPKVFSIAMMGAHDLVFGRKPDVLLNFQQQHYESFLGDSERYLFSSTLNEWASSTHEQDVILNTDFTTHVMAWLKRTQGIMAELQVAFRLPHVVAIRKYVKDYFLNEPTFKLSSFLRAYLRRLPNYEADVIYIDNDGVVHLVEVKGQVGLLNMEGLQHQHVVKKFRRLVLLRRSLKHYGISVKIDLYCVRCHVSDNVGEFLQANEIGYYRLDPGSKASTKFTLK